MTLAVRAGSMNLDRARRVCVDRAEQRGLRNILRRICPTRRVQALPGSGCRPRRKPVHRSSERWRCRIPLRKRTHRFKRDLICARTQRLKQIFSRRRLCCANFILTRRCAPLGLAAATQAQDHRARMASKPVPRADVPVQARMSMHVGALVLEDPQTISDRR